MKPAGTRDSFRTVSLYPTEKDFGQTNFDSLSRNIIEGSYRDVEHYLNVLFHLLREDFVCPLRKGINSYKRLLDPSQDDPKEQESSVHIFYGVRVLGVVCGKEQIYEISYRVNLNRNYCAKIRWENTKRLLFGSLVMFSNDHFKSFQLAVVTERNLNSLRKGFLSVKFVGRDVYVSTIHRDQYVMAESDAFFEPVYQTLKTLQSIKSIPMEKYFLVHDVSRRRPFYTALGSELRVYDHIGVNMNESQWAALNASLRQEFVVVQGPPGTGKTFLALNIIKILLNNFRSVTPLLLLSYTNHALDLFLEGTLKFTKRVVRIGGQSQNKVLDQYNFQKIKEQLLKNMNNTSRGSRLNWFTCTSESGIEEKVYVNWPNTYNRSLPVLKRELKQSYLEILVETEVVRTIENQLGLVYVITFHNRMGLNYSTGFRNNDEFLVWLLGNEYETIKSLVKNENNRETNAEEMYEDEESSRRRNLLGQSEDEPLLTFEFEKELKRHICLTFEALESALIILENRHNRDYVQIRILSIIENIRNGLNSNVQNKSFKGNNSYSGDLWSLSYQERWNLYNIWVEKIRTDIVGKLETKKTKHAQRFSQLKDIRLEGDLELLVALKPDIVGMTTTGAARLHQLLSRLAPRIVIVEEAAQVLEAHIISSLSRSCEHLILIGDHMQLRPSPSTYELARWYGLDVSLFQRMLNNGVYSKTLNVQHRMKPNIAALIAPSIYPDLTNHPSVSTYPPILGVSKNLFFIDHKNWEKSDLVSQSRSNPHEAKFMIALCRYLILQGYEASDIVILTTYSSQQFYLRDLQKKEKLLADVRMTVVDNYQEEECKIVLLSLVRSNREGNIGFLGAENRICVALSRAKHGLYIIGNMQLLKTRSTLWKQINATLQAQYAIGASLPLVCQLHKLETLVQCSNDFESVKTGACSRPCVKSVTPLPCGHYCKSVCHLLDKDHKKCLEPCKRLCSSGHPCQLRCYEKCECKVEVGRTLPHCGHHAQMLCYQDPRTHRCTEKIEFTPNCGHVQLVECSIILDERPFECTMPCSRVHCRKSVWCTEGCFKRVDETLVAYPYGGSLCGYLDDSQIYMCGHSSTSPCTKPCGECMRRIKKVFTPHNSFNVMGYYIHTNIILIPVLVILVICLLYSATTETRPHTKRY